MCEESMGAVGNGSHEFVIRGEAGAGDVFVVKVDDPSSSWNLELALYA